MKVELEVNSIAPHLQQLFCGFIELNKKNIIKLYVNRNIINNECFLKAKINGNTIIYDTADNGDYFIKDSEFEKCDYYFKRSYDKKRIIKKFGEIGLKKIKPLGLNYLVYGNSSIINGIKGNYIIKSKNLIKNIDNISSFKNYYMSDFENIPYYNKDFKINFFTRVWSDNNAVITNEKYREKLKKINDVRAECIRTCKKEFGDRFIGGLQRDDFSTKYYKDCIIEDESLVKRSIFLDNVKKSNICISTTGLHDSIGWKMGEYVAASRGIVSEKLMYEVPGEFSDGKNFLEFGDINQCLSSIYKLVDDKYYLEKMMFENWNYYHNNVRPDILVFNTIKEFM
ncbi:hypothetical protein FDB64_12330 [Clostridium botulinum]|uniref:hypothetical protein n=1 Tax=Clostridium botulinum TaxID=1491 RepID=UPI0013F036BC|nr:hypothetical protein [Clostridium botulinum]MBY6917959.1 hypothetical protein [Clostridium botulinum]NFL35842.1 hypothetical protein [Clostridium botulinum]NFM05038.1 hypothetical protein [Clostridium botulinum]NFO40971.1 hypothetical protein [Clostridium botulinum]NFQ39713.1 hypothetical protein [Clostridium botulinum]